MKTGTDWNDLAYFSAIARTGSLSRASRELGVSPATLSRHMKTFETTLGRRLFLHGPDGYALTADGRALADRTRSMEDAAHQIALWRGDASAPVSVRISAGTWTAYDLAEHLPEYWSPTEPWLPEFKYCDMDLDVARREIDIGIRNRRPEQPWVARQQIGTVDYAVYGANESIHGWIGSSWDSAMTPSTQWIQENHSAQIATKANSPHLAAALARAGVGRVVLPMFVGERAADLVRLSDPIVELQSEQWLVSHHDARHDPPSRAALTAIGRYLAGRQ